MKNIIFLLASIIAFTFTKAQLCPGGGLDFANAVLFNPTWTSGCATGTGCTGGTTFDNRTACEPTAALDACAPGPSCGTAGNTGSDLWFKFYASSTTASINILPSVSFNAGIQAFSNTGSVCNSLIQVGCAVASSNSGVALNLSGLTVGTLYYYRVFGNASNASQRTGTFCFCGSTGMSNIVLPLKLLSFTGKNENGATFLKWVATEQRAVSHFEIQKSSDGILFNSIGTREIIALSTGQQQYSFIDNNASEGISYYRLKVIDEDGQFEYSSIVKVIATEMKRGFAAYFDNSNHQLHIQAIQESKVTVYTTSGSKLLTLEVEKGENIIPCFWKSGLYILKTDKGESKKLWIFQ